MTVKGYGNGDPKNAAYAERLLAPEDAVLAEARERSAREGLPEIQVGKLDGLHLEVLARAFGATKAVEIGTLGGYSGIALLRGLGPSGLLHTFELDAHHADVARASFERAGLAGRVRVHVGPALDHLPSIEGEGPFDLVFIDADKPGYPAYLDWAARNLRVGGAVLADNVFGWGGVADEAIATPQVVALRQFNERLARSGAFRATLLPTDEGLALGVKL